MATQRDVRKIALALPETSEDPDRFCFFVEGKQFVWVWLERVEPKKARVPNPDVIVVRVADDLDKQVLLASDARSSSPRRTTTGTPPSSCGSRRSTARA
jgi:hypothetical protein